MYQHVKLGQSVNLPITTQDSSGV